MNELEPPDSHYLRAAEGWLGLGNHSEAHLELARIDRRWAAHPEVLRVRFDALGAGQRWEEALEVARQMVKLEPSRSLGWINRSNALHFLGRFREAYDELHPGLKLFPKNPTIPYNLACFECRMGRLAVARDWLMKALAMDQGGEMRRAARADTDLEPLWPELKTAEPG